MSRAKTYRLIGLYYKKGPNEICEWTPFQQIKMLDLDDKDEAIIKFDSMEEFMLWRTSRK